MEKPSLSGPNCLLCGSKSLYWFVTENSGVGPNSSFKVFKCSTCRSTRITPTPENLDLYYSNYHSLPTGKSWVRSQKGCKNRMRIIKENIQKSQIILDIGAGSGAFVSASINSGFQTQAIEIDVRCREHIKNNLGIEVSRDLHEYSKKNLPAPKVVTLWHVFEHIPNPIEFLEQVIVHFGSDIKIFIEVPNADSWQFRLFRCNWPHLDVPRHLFIPSEKGIQILARKYKMCAKSVRNRDKASWSAFGIVNLGKRRGTSLLELRARRILQIFLTPMFALERREISATRTYLLTKE
jgi:hypothetical protein